jgi:2,4-dienoyl-CoA reductase-like NADH-dependent reductase (Old Yellow Enzyme family)
MSRLFEETLMNKLAVDNRFVRSATWEGLATAEGFVTPELVDMMASLAKGGVGLIICSHAYVSREGQGTPLQLGIYKDELIPGLKQMTSAVHENGGKILVQLAHAGIHAGHLPEGLSALAVSAEDESQEKNSREITKDGIKGLVEAFAQGAKRAMAANFDGIEIHSAHGYFLSQFLSPAYNRRRDEYGGTVNNRARIHLEIYEAVRKIVGKDVPLLIKMNCEDFINGGLTGDESVMAAKLFADAGFDAIEISGGVLNGGKLSPTRPGITTMDKEAYFREYAARFRKEIKIPLILVGGVRSFEVAEKIVADGVADYISMARPFIREPGLINRWKNGDLRKAECKSDNLCFNPGFEGRGIYCVSREIEENRMPGK